MNSVPKTVYHTKAYQSSSFTIVQCSYTGGVAMFYAGKDTDSVDGFSGVMAVFRVYPKGQNPISIKKRQIENETHLL